MIVHNLITESMIGLFVKRKCEKYKGDLDVSKLKDQFFYGRLNKSSKD